MPNHPRLYHRGKTYYLRVAVPADIKKSFGKHLVVKSLKTANLQEALPRLRAASAKVDEDFAAHRRAKPVASNSADLALPKSSASLTPERHKQNHIENHLKRRATLFEASESDTDAFLRGKLIELPDTQYFDHLSGEGTWSDLLAYCIRYELKRALKVAEKREARGDFSELIGLAGGSATTAVKLLHAEIEALEQLINGLDKELQGSEGAFEAGIPRPEPDKAAIDENVDVMSQAIAKYLQELKQSGLPQKTRDGKQFALQEFIEICGDKAVTEYTKKDGRFYKDVVVHLPANRKKQKLFSGIGAIEASRIAKDSQTVKTIAIKTANERIGAITACFNWIDKNYDSDVKNPVADMKLRETKRAGDKRQPFSIDDLNKIFHAPVFTGCESEKNWKGPGNTILSSSAKYWVPLIGLYSGMRLGEIIQLNAEDIKVEDCRYYFDICHDTKTQSGLRKIPVHPKLIELGVLELSRKRGGRIFHDYKQAKDGSWSDAFSKHFRRFLKDLNVDGSFHCFRHNFEDACRRCAVPADVMDGLQGHAQEKLRGTYGNQSDPFGLKRLTDEVRKIEYSELDLTHLIKCE